VIVGREEGHRWVDDDASFREVLAHLRAADVYGLDTEFHRERTYHARLALLQLSWPEGIAVVDPLAVDIAPLAEVLDGPGLCVMHAASQDLEILARVCGTVPSRLFDTQVAAGFAGFAAQAGYTGLLHDVLKIRVAKTASFTRWDARPLTQEQVSYAKEDVEHLLPLADEIQKRLLSTGRLEWAREECRAIAASSDERDPEEVWRRLPRATGLDPRERAVARELGAWRERTAMKEDRPVGSIIRDPTLVELAKRQPAGRRELGAIRGLNPDVVRRRSADLLAAIERGQSAPPIRLEEAERLQTESVDGPAIALSEALVRARAQEAGLAYELIAARADLTPIVVAARRGDPDPSVRTLQGWRRELVGNELLELLRGRRRLGIGEGGRVEIL
jgi:ribonuclease D